MPSASDFFTELQGANTRLDQVKSQLTALKASVDAVKASTDAVKTSVQQVNGTLASGFGALVTLGTYTNEALHHNASQNETIICLLDAIARNTCALVNSASEQTRMQVSLESSNRMLAELYAATHAEAALARQQHEALRAEIERCCPPRTPEPPCRFEPCEAPKGLKGPPTVKAVKIEPPRDAPRDSPKDAREEGAPKDAAPAAKKTAPAGTPRKAMRATRAKTRTKPARATSSGAAKKASRRRRRKT